MPRRYLCIHGHFYQPPREDPHFGAVPREASAAPWRDWNRRITDECYGPLAALPGPAQKGKKQRGLENLYSLISFNFGPTLLSWLEKHNPAVYMAVLEADRVSAKARSGHGNAIAQAYNHVILPLASLRDKRTQVKWGLEDFKSRFKRDAHALWLSETAVDSETLEVLCEFGLSFAVLSCTQARRVRAISASKWEAVNETTLDTTVPYRWFSRRQPGRSIDIFFSSRALEQAASDRTLFSGPEQFHTAVQNCYRQGYAGLQLAQLASDGEVYGHHHKEAGHLLASALKLAQKDGFAKLTNYGEFLELCPPELEIEIAEPSSWSCPHGVGRWSEDCGCRISEGTSQGWRRPLRESLNFLAEGLDAVYQEKASGFFKDPWRARDDYAACLSSDRMSRLRSFLESHSVRALHGQELSAALRLLEMQRQRLLMFTSCGWFFDEISGLEPVQALKSAARALELSGQAGGRLELDFLNRLEHCPSNIKKYGTGAGVYNALAKPAREPFLHAAVSFCSARVLTRGLPFADRGFFHFKMLEFEHFVSAATSVDAAYLHAERADTLEQKFFSVFSLRTLAGGGFECFARECQSRQEHDAMLAELRKYAPSAEADSPAALFSIRLAYEHFSAEQALLDSDRDAAAFLDGQNKPLLDWLRAVRTANYGGDLVSQPVLDALQALSASGMEAAHAPFLPEIRTLCATRLSLALESRNAVKLGLIMKWLAFLAAKGVPVWEFNLALGPFLREGSSAGFEPDFAAVLQELQALLSTDRNLNDNKKN